MPGDDHDHLAFDIKFALTYGRVSMAARKFVRGLSHSRDEQECLTSAWRRQPTGWSEHQ